MNQLGEAIARYHKTLESTDLSWAHQLQERMREHNLVVNGRPISPVMRPNFITRRQYANLSKAAESLVTSIDRVETIALSSPALLARMELLPAEKMLASVDPGYPALSVTSLLDTHLHNGTLRFVQYNSEVPTGVAYGDALAELFHDAPPVKDLRKKYALSRLGGMKPLLQALIKTYREWGGKNKKPHIGILEFRQPFQTIESRESQLFADFFRKEGYETQIVSPDQLEYRNNVLRFEHFPIDLMFRRVKVQEFLVRFDLSHPLLRAYREGRVCVVNSFRSEISQKKAIFHLLTDDSVTGSFPASERKAIREFIPWTRVVTQSKTTYGDENVDLPEFILKNREKLVLKPNDDSTDASAVLGSAVNESAWEKALKSAMRSPFVVQEAVAPVHSIFPVLQYGNLEMREMRVDVHPHTYLGRVQGCSSWISSGASGFSTLSGLAPTFLIEGK